MLISFNNQESSFCCSQKFIQPKKNKNKVMPQAFMAIGKT